MPTLREFMAATNAVCGPVKKPPFDLTDGASYGGVRPPCYNRPARAEGRWHKVASDSKPRYRWFPRWFIDRCATKDGTGIGPNGENYPDAHGWNCGGCKWA